HRSKYVGYNQLKQTYIFFLQAEDGIRDRNVTGVQTCALPISSLPCWVPSFFSPTTGVYNPKTFFLHAASLHQGFPHCAIFPTARSEERRVGKECIFRWASDH